MTDTTELSTRMGNVPALSGDAGAPRALFMPSNWGEAMRMAEIMADGNFVPAHLRGKPGDCLAVIIQSARWGMDPFAVCGGTFFINGRMSYESKLIVAVVNSSGQLSGRLRPEWRGEGEDMVCTVTGSIKGEAKPFAIEQPIKSITVRNSPLWKSSPKMQLGYYTQRLWARLYMPQVLLGVYTEDEVAEMGPERARPVVPSRGQIAEPTPTKVIEAVRGTPAIFTDDPEDGDGRLPGEQVVDEETGEITEAQAEPEAVKEPKRRGRPPKSVEPAKVEPEPARVEAPEPAVDEEQGSAPDGDTAIEQAEAAEQDDEVDFGQAEQVVEKEPAATLPARKPRPDGPVPERTEDGVSVPQTTEQWQAYAAGVISLMKQKGTMAELEKLIARQEKAYVYAPDDLRDEIEAVAAKKRQDNAGF